MESNRNAPFGTTPGATGATPLGASAGAQGGMGGNAGQPGVTDKAREVAQEARQKAGEQVRTGLDLGKGRAAEALHGVANSLHQSIGEADQQDGVTRYIQQAGDQVKRAADYLERTDVRDMVRHTEEFARRQPVLFLGGALALGLTAARFLRSSQRQQQQSQTGYDGEWQSERPYMPSYERERPVGGYQAGASYADTQSGSIPEDTFGTGATGAGGGAAGGMSAGLAPSMTDTDDAGETGMPPFGSSTRNRR